MIQPLKINKKVDNDAKVAQIIKENIPNAEYMSADEVNAMVAKINEMVPAINVSNGGFQGTLNINEKRVDSGFYIPQDDGKYINAGDVVVDRSKGIHFVTYDGDKWDVAVVPIVADGKVEEGNAGFVSGGEVSKEVVLNSDLTYFQSRNIFDKNKVVKGRYVNTSNGYLSSNNEASASDIIDVKGCAKVYVLGYNNVNYLIGYRFLNENEEVVSYGTAGSDIDKFVAENKNNAKYFQFTLKTSKKGEISNYDEFIVSCDTGFIDYEPYEIYGIKSIKNLPIGNENNKSYTYPFMIKDSDKHFSFKEMIPYISKNTLGVIRGGVRRFNKVILYAYLNSDTDRSKHINIGYVDKLGAFNVSDVVVLDKVSVKEVQLRTILDARVINCNKTIEIPEGKYVVVFSDTPIGLGVYDNSYFEGDEYKLIYSQDGKSFGYGYRSSSGVKFINDEENTSKIKGKNIAIIADSIVAYQNTWAKMGLFEKSNVIDVSVSGARFTDYQDTTIDFSGLGNNNNTAFNQVLRLARLTAPKGEQIKIAHPITKMVFEVPVEIAVGLGQIDKLDYILVMLGTNDQEYTKTNAFEDYMSIDFPEYNRKANIVTGAMWCIEALKCLYPKAKIIVSTPLQSNPTGSRNFKITRNKRNRIVEVAEYFGTDFIDSFYKSGISEKLETNIGEDGMYLQDGLHPNQTGNQVLSSFYLSYLETK